MNAFKILLIPILFSFASCSRNPVTGKNEVMLMSEGQEIALGEQSDPGIIQEFGLYNNDAMQKFINEKGLQMAAISHRPNLAYKFRILDSPIVNAFAVPGGYVYFTRGIMAHFNNEAEFAGVLGHEIGHIAAKHSAKQYTKQMITQVALLGGMIVSEDFRKYADLASTGLGILFLKFSRDNESESDKLGVDYSTKIGYNADEMSGFFKTLERLGGSSGSIPTFLSTHPNPGDRFNTVGAYANKVQEEGHLTNAQLKVNREDYLRMVDGLVYGEDPRQGYVEGSNFYHPELLFTFNIPTGWKTVNSPAQIQMAPSDGKAILFLQLAEEKDLQSASAAMIKNNQISVIESVNTTVNGNSAIAISGEQTQESSDPQNPQVLKIICYLIQYNGAIYKLTGLSTKADFNNYFGTFQTSIRSFKKLTEASKINVYPEKIKLVKTTKSSTFQQAMLDFKMPADRIDELGVVNGMEKTDQVQSGTTLKIVQKSSGK